MPIKKVVSCILVACFTVLLNSSFLGALDHSDVRIEPGGFSFKASFKLHHTFSDLVVKLTASRGTRMAMCVNGPIHPLALVIDLQCTIDGKQRAMQIVPQGHKRHKFYEMSVSRSSSWYSTIRKLAKKAASRYYSASNDIPQKLKSYISKKSSSHSAQIKNLSGCTLNTVDAVRIMSLRSQVGSRFPRRVLVRGSIYPVRDGKGREELIAVATFNTQEAATDDDPKSIVKFVYTKNRLKEISRKHLGRSSIWYWGVKKIIKENIRKYLKFRRIYERKLCN